MNPPLGDDDENAAYRGSEPLDAALADRFAFVVQMPAWEAFTDGDREELVLASGSDLSPAAAGALRQALQQGNGLFAALRDELAGRVATYVRLVVGLLNQAGIEISARRAAQLHRNIIAVHAAGVLAASAWDPADSAYLALVNSIPGRAEGKPVDEMKLLAAHRGAWDAAGFDPADPRRLLLAESDPVRRVLLAARFEDLPAGHFSSVVADALATLPPRRPPRPGRVAVRGRGSRPAPGRRRRAGRGARRDVHHPPGTRADCAVGQPSARRVAARGAGARPARRRRW